MTGLDPAVDELVEIAVIVTDSNLAPLAPGIDVVIKPSSAALAQMGDFVTQMHTQSGLLEVLDEGESLAEAQRQVLDYVRSLVAEPGLAPVAGNSVGQDLRFLRAYMPDLVEHFHYRVIDVSTIKELAKRWFPRVSACSPEKHGGHRALGDIEDSIVELQYYRRALFPAELDPEKGFYCRLGEAVAEEMQRQFKED